MSQESLNEVDLITQAAIKIFVFNRHFDKFFEANATKF